MLNDEFHPPNKLDSANSFGSSVSHISRPIIPNLISAEGFNSPISLSNEQVGEALQYIQNYDYINAISKLTKSLQVNAYNPLSLAYRADCYLACGDQSSSVEDIRSAMFICTQLIEAIHYNSDVGEDKNARQQNVLVSQHLHSILPPMEVKKPTLSDMWLQYNNLTSTQLSKQLYNLKVRLASLLSTCCMESMDLGHIPLGLHLAQEAQHHHLKNPYYWIKRCLLYIQVGEINQALNHLNLVLDHIQDISILQEILIHSNFNIIYTITGTVIVDVEHYEYLEYYPVTNTETGQVDMYDQSQYNREERLQQIKKDLLGHLKCIDMYSKSEYVQNAAQLAKIEEHSLHPQQTPSSSPHIHSKSFELEKFNSVTGNGIVIELSVFIEALILRANIYLRLGVFDLCKRDVVTLLHLHPIHTDILSLLTKLRSMTNGLALKTISELLVVVNTANTKDKRDVKLTLENCLKTASLAISVLYTPRIACQNEAASYGSKSVLQLLKIDLNPSSSAINTNQDLKQHIYQYETTFCLALTSTLGGTSLVLQLLLMISRIYYICEEYSSAEQIIFQIYKIRQQRLEELYGAAWTTSLQHYEQGQLHQELEEMLLTAANEFNIYNIDLAVAWLLRNSKECDEEQDIMNMPPATLDETMYKKFIQSLQRMLPLLKTEWKELQLHYTDILQLHTDIQISESIATLKEKALSSEKIWIARQEAKVATSYTSNRVNLPTWSWEYATVQDKDCLIDIQRKLETMALKNESNALLWLCICDIQLRLSEYQRGVEDISKKSITYHTGNTKETRKIEFPNIKRNNQLIIVNTNLNTDYNKFGKSNRYSEVYNQSLRKGGQVVQVQEAKEGTGKDSMEWLTKASAVALYAIEIDKHVTSKAQARLAQIYLQIGRDLFNAQRYDQAEIEIERAIIYAPKSPGLYLFRARIRKIRGVVAASIQDLHTCLQLDPNNTDAKKLQRELQFIVKTN